MEIKSRITGEVLHVVFNLQDFKDGRLDLIAPDNHLQCAALKLPKDTRFKPHKHIDKNGPEKIIAQESWVVISGKILVTYFDIDDCVLAMRTLRNGDACFTLRGGHTYEVIEDSIIYEFKTGPYRGQAEDKQFID